MCPWSLKFGRRCQGYEQEGSLKKQGLVQGRLKGWRKWASHQNRGRRPEKKKTRHIYTYIIDRSRRDNDEIWSRPSTPTDSQAAAPAAPKVLAGLSIEQGCVVSWFEQLLFKKLLILSNFRLLLPCWASTFVQHRPRPSTSTPTTYTYNWGRAWRRPGARAIRCSDPDLADQPLYRATNKQEGQHRHQLYKSLPFPILFGSAPFCPGLSSIRQAPPLCHGDFFFLLFCLPTLLLVSFKQLSFDFGPILVFVPCRFVFFRRLEEVLCCFESNCDLHRCCSFLFLRHPYEIVWICDGVGYSFEWRLPVPLLLV